MITQKRKKLAQELFESLKAKFPEVELVGLTESPEDPDSTWVNIVMPDDEDRGIDFREFAAEQTTDILLDQDVHFSVVSDLYDIWIQFRARGLVNGNRYKKYQNIHRKISDLIQSHGAGVMGALSRGSHGPLVMFCRLKSLDFAHQQIPCLLEKLDALDGVKIYWNHPEKTYPFKTQLYPPQSNEEG